MDKIKLYGLILLFLDVYKSPKVFPMTMSNLLNERRKNWQQFGGKIIPKSMTFFLIAGVPRWTKNNFALISQNARSPPFC